MTSSDTLEVEQLIREIQKYPELWDPSCEQYREKPKKKAAWRQIAAHFYDDFQERTELEKNDIVSKLAVKWRNIKDNYYRSIRNKLKQGQSMEFGRGYLYSKQLAFLSKTERSQASRAVVSFQQHSEDSDETGSTAEPIVIVSTEEHEDQTRTHQPMLKRRRESVEGSSSFDDDRFFFDSLLPAVNTFNIDQKLEFRGEIIKLIQKIRSRTPP